MNAKPTILIMDDEIDVRKALVRLLTHIGYDCSQSDCGEEAVSMYTDALHAGHPFNLVIMDLDIPSGMGGEDCFKRLQAIDPNVNAIVSSGHVLDSQIPYYQSIGFKAVLIKPYTLGALAKVLEDVISQA